MGDPVLLSVTQAHTPVVEVAADDTNVTATLTG